MSSVRKKPRVVIDTNIVLSALVFSQGKLAPLRLAWQSAQFQPLVSRVTVAELIRVLSYPKFKLSVADQHEILADYLPYCTTVRIPVKPPHTPACRDIFDIPFLQLAVAGKADYLVSGDNDLLNITTPFACPIIMADQFMKMINY
jgi:putative PIN family toxin of toxin-antitoxin system